MIITCKACQKRYLLEKEDIGPEGRQVRCVACGHSWQQYHVKENINSILSKPLTFDPGYSTDVRPTRRFPWTYLVGLLITTLIALYLGRTSIVARWPQTEKIFIAFKIPIHHPYEGLSLDHIMPLQVNYMGRNSYVLKGDIHNESDLVKSIPAFKILAQGDCRKASSMAKFNRFMRQLKAKISGNLDPNAHLCILESWSYRLKETKILPGERIAFETPARAEVLGAENISIEF
ncbi:MAG: zinc-ribbon domain-containing protein [Janthinobacterium lividum]